MRKKNRYPLPEINSSAKQIVASAFLLFGYVLKCVPILLITLQQHTQKAAVFSRNIRSRSAFLHKQSQKERKKEKETGYYQI